MRYWVIGEFGRTGTRDLDLYLEQELEQELDLKLEEERQLRDEDWIPDWDPERQERLKNKRRKKGTF